jgi:hypothetical protein
MLASTATIAQNSTIAWSAPIELTHGKPFVQVMVNDKGPFRFVIDTGTGSEAFVSAELADVLHLPVTGQIHLSDPSKQGGQKVPLVKIQSLEVAGVTFSGVTAVRHTLGNADGNCDGLLGFGLFRDYLMTLDYPGRRMTLTSGALARDTGQSVLAFRMPYGIPIVPIEIGSIEIEAQIDSGGTGLSLPETIADRLRFASNPELFGTAESLSTRFEIRAARLADDVLLGGYRFAHPFVEINSAFPLANFGSSAMQDFAFTFDQKNKLVRLASRRRTQRLEATHTPLQMERAPQYKPSDIALVPVG